MGPETSLGQASSTMRAASSARPLEPKMPAIAVNTRKNGNIDISADSAIWLAIAQPSSATNSQKASTANRRLRRRRRKGVAILTRAVYMTDRVRIATPLRLLSLSLRFAVEAFWEFVAD